MGPRLLLVAEQLRGPVPGGIGTYAAGVLQGLAALGRAGLSGPNAVDGLRGPNAVDITLWASRPPLRGPDPLRALGLPVVTSALPGRALVRAWDRGWAKAPPSYDVVHAPSLAAPPPGDAPLGVTVHDLAWRRVPETFPARGRRWHEAAFGRALLHAAVLVAPSHQTADDLLAAGAPAGRVEVVEEGADHLPAPDHAGAAALRARLGVGEEYLFTASTLEPRKNLPRLIAAYQQARPRLPGPWPLLIAGPAGWGPALTTSHDGVVLAGQVEPAVLAGLYARARLVASVPVFEGFGLPALEAMACGAPVLASPQPSTGGAAVEVDPRDVAAMATAMVRLATDEVLRADVVAAGRARAATLTWAAAAARHVEIWGSLRHSSGRHVQP